MSTLNTRQRNVLDLIMDSTVGSAEEKRAEAIYFVENYLQRKDVVDVLRDHDNEEIQGLKDYLTDDNNFGQ